jgi:hypothetical protein
MRAFRSYWGLRAGGGAAPHFFLRNDDNLCRSTEDAHLSSDSQTGDNTAAHSASEANTPSCPASPESRSASNPATPSLLSTPGYGANGSSRRRRRIGVGMDGSRGCVEALSWAIKNIYRHGDIIVLITCQPLQFIPGAGEDTTLPVRICGLCMGQKSCCLFGWLE